MSYPLVPETAGKALFQHGSGHGLPPQMAKLRQYSVFELILIVNIHGL
jgi:hypothetical protein